MFVQSRIATYFCLSLEKIYVRPGHRRAILNEVVFFWSSCSIAVVFRRTLTNFIGTPSDCRRLLTITCSCAIFRLSKKVRPHLYGESLSRVEGSLSPPSWVNFWERFYENKVDHFDPANSTRACSDCLEQGPDCLALTELTRLGEPKCLYEKMFAQLRGDPGRRDVITDCMLTDQVLLPINCLVHVLLQQHD